MVGLCPLSNFRQCQPERFFMISKIQSRLAVLVLAASSALPALAVGPDFTTLTTAVDFTTVGTAVLAIAALMIVPKVIGWGARKVMGFVRG